MSDCTNIPTLDDIETSKKNMDTIDEVVTSNNDYTSPATDGENKLTLTGLYAKMGGVNVGDYINGTTLINVNDYVYHVPTRQAYVVKSVSDLPYLINTTLYPNPANDPKLKTFTEVSKADFDLYKQQIESQINALELGQGSGVIGYATQAELFANLDFDEGSIGYVTNDVTPVNNGTYLKVGVSGSGSWVQSNDDIASQAYQKSNLVEQLNEIVQIQSLATGINMFDKDHPSNIPNTFLNNDGTTSTGLNYYTVSHFIPVFEGGEVFLSKGAYPTSSASVCYYDDNLNFVRGENAASSIIPQIGEKFVKVSLRHDVAGAPAYSDLVVSDIRQATGLPYRKILNATTSYDIYPEGKIDFYTPTIRNNNGEVITSNVTTRWFGFDKSVKCAQTGNTYVYKKSDVGGKKYVAMMFSYHNNAIDTPITQINVLGSEGYNTSLTSPTTLQSFDLDCGNGVVLHGKVVEFAATHDHFYLGTIRSFPNTTAEMFGFALMQYRESDGVDLAKQYISDCLSRGQRREVTNRVKDYLENEYSGENLFPAGMFDAEYPPRRSGSPIVDVTAEPLLDLGFDKAYLQRQTGNEFAYVVDERIGGKDLLVAAINYSEPFNSSILNVFSSVEPLGSLNIPTVLHEFTEDIGDGVQILYKIVRVTALDKTLYLGTAVVPSWDSYWCGQFALDVTGFSITSGSIVALQRFYRKTISEKLSRKSVVSTLRSLSDFKQDNTTSVEIAGEFLTIESNRVTRKLSAYRNSDSVTSSIVFNYATDAIDGNDLAGGLVSGDDVAPIHAYGTTLMANHSYIGDILTASGHNKTSIDIGSVYSNGGNDYVLVEVISPNSLVVMRSGSNSNAPSSGVLTYVSGGSDTSDITYTSRVLQQIYPCYTNYRKNSFLDNYLIDEQDGFYSYSNNFKIVESYDLLERQSIYDWYVNDYDGTRNPTGESVMNYSGAFRFDNEGNCTQSGYYVVTQPFLMADIMGLQSVRKLTTEYYIPKTVAFNYDGSQVNFSLKASSTTCSGGSQTSIFFTPDKLDGSAIPSDRWVQINSDGTYYAMGFAPLGDAGNNRAGNVTAFTCEIRGNTDKIYPRLLDVGDFTTSVGDSWSFVGYRNVGKPQGIETCSYPVRTDGDDFYYVDYHNVSSIDTLDMPTDFIGRNFEIIESRNVLIYGSLMSARMTFNVDCVGDYGYIVLRIIA